MNEETKALVLTTLKDLQEMALQDINLELRDVGIGFSNWWADNEASVAESIRCLETL